MKKNFKFMLVALMALMSTGTYAQSLDFNDDNFKYVSDDATLVVSGTKGTGEVAIYGIQNPLSGEVTVPNTVTYKAAGVTYTLKVTVIDDDALQNQLMTSISIPANVKEIGDEVFTGCTYLETVTFANNSQLEKIGDRAFATTAVTEYDFSKCTKLQGFPDELFIETGMTNTFITKITMPTTTAFKEIGTALASLPNLAETNLASTKIQEVVASAFASDAKLTSVELPGTVKKIRTDAFKGSKVATLVINVGSIDATDGIEANAYSATAAEKSQLTSLTLKGELKGKIAANAFNGSDKLATLDLSELSFGTNASVMANAFGGIALIESITLKNIGDNGTGAYTIQSNAFHGAKLASVTIGNITANQAIDANAFNTGTTYTLTSVKLGNVYSGGLAIAAGAFNFAKIADGKKATVEIGNVRATAMTPIFAAGAFVFDAATANKANLEIKIGAVESAGKVFTAGTFAFTTDPLTVSVTFDGDIEYDGIDVAILAKNDNLSALTFNGKLAVGAIKAGAFAGIGDFFDPTDDDLKKIKPTVTFNGSLAEYAVEAGAFDISGNLTNKALIVKYTANPDDASVIPFMQDAFGDGTNATQPLLADADRSVTLEISNTELKALIMSLQEACGSADEDEDIIYFVVLLDDSQDAMKVYLKTGTNTSYGRFDLTSLALTNGITIARRQNGITYTLYSTYVEDDADNEIVTINMQPIPSTDGKYVLDIADIGTGAGQLAVLIIKAVGTTEQETIVEWSDETTGASNPFYTDNELAVYTGTDNVTNQQLVDGTAVAPFNALFNAKGEAVKDIYFLNNPADHTGITAKAWDIKKSKVYVAPGSFYIVAPHYAKAAAARIVWLDGGEETGISTLKTAVENGVIYNLAGQKVNANYKGVVIKNGNKMIQK